MMGRFDYGRRYRTSKRNRGGGIGGGGRNRWRLTRERARQGGR